jgi:hypothetical protein
MGSTSAPYDLVWAADHVEPQRRSMVSERPPHQTVLCGETMTSRKDAIREYKERAPNRGAYVIRCAVSDRVWAGASTNLDAARNRAWFTLRLGQHGDRALQAEWNTHGEATFQYDVLETLEDDVSPMAMSDLLKEKMRDWATRLDAPMLLP